MGKFKTWEVLLFVAVVLLAPLVYESHNDGGRYVPIGGSIPGSKALLDTRTGKIWWWNKEQNEWYIRNSAIPKGL